MRQVITYTGHDQPLVEVLVDDRWYPGDLRAWRQHDDDTWSAQVTWSRRPGERRLEVFEAERVRPVDQ
ncbi:hypothetical protein [Nocardioides sp. InS609-2]|uniref:hypothetical protein n=1 Tax=Nocardioides sp. InS609-2 TaxID=2760705 RepID=UPI0020BD5B13|nr:hypothetical protein [Nocardioides sp. InS609-2]